MGIIQDLKKQRKNEEVKVDYIVEAMYNSCVKIIKMKNKLGITNMIYEVPLIFIGFPLYDREKVSFELNKQFKEKGFKTTYYYPSKIYISWA
jgi:hypothetical protein